MTTSDAFANEAESPYVLSYIGQVIHKPLIKPASKFSIFFVALLPTFLPPFQLKAPISCQLKATNLTLRSTLFSGPILNAFNKERLVITASFHQCRVAQCRNQ